MLEVSADGVPAVDEEEVAGAGAGGGLPHFTVGDIVVGVATKAKADWNGHKCQIDAILTKFYKVQMLEGPQKNKEHKYLHHCVSLKPPLGGVFQAATGAAPQAATVADNAGTAEPEAAAADAPAATSASPILSVAELWSESDFQCCEDSVSELFL